MANPRNLHIDPSAKPRTGRSVATSGTRARGTIRLAQERVRVVFTNQWALAMLLAVSVTFNVAQCFNRVGPVPGTEAANAANAAVTGGARPISAPAVDGRPRVASFYDAAANTLNVRGTVHPAPPFPVLVTAITDGQLKRWEVREYQSVTEGDTLCILSNAALVADSYAAQIEANAAMRYLDRVTPEARQPELDALDGEIRRVEERRRMLTEQVNAAANVREAMSDLEYLALIGARDEAALELQIIHRRRDTLALEIDQTHAQAHARTDSLRIRAESLLQQVGGLVVKAPTAGLVLERFAREGSWVRSLGEGAGRLLTLYQPDLLVVRVLLAESDANKVYLGQAARIHLDSGGSAYDGRVREILPKANENANALVVLVDVIRPDQRARPGIAVEVAFDQSAVPQAPSATTASR